MKLEELIDKYGSDKNASKYTEAYVHFFEPIKTGIPIIETKKELKNFVKKINHNNKL